MRINVRLKARPSYGEQLKKLLKLKPLRKTLLLCAGIICLSLTASAQIWTGATSTDWNTASNWGGGFVPTANNSIVIIPSAPANQPVISAAGAVVNNIEVDGTLTIQSTGTLAVNGFQRAASGQTVALTNYGTVENSGVLLIGNVYATGQYALLNAGTFNNNMGGQISIDRSTDVGLFNYGTFTNAGVITIGAAGGVGSNGLYNSLIFNNSGCAALLRVVSDNIIDGGSGFSNSGTVIENAIGNSNIGNNTGTVQNLNGGTFTITNNTGVLTTAALGTVWTGCTSTDWNTASNWSGFTVPTATDDVVIPLASANQPLISTPGAVAQTVEIQSGTTLTIQSTGTLAVNGSKNIGGTTTAFYNNGTVANSGGLLIGNVSAAGTIGLYNLAAFNNNTGAQISIDRPLSYGLYNKAGTFTNAGAISIGGTAGVGQNGLRNDGGTFNNNTGGQISIDRITYSLGIGLESSGTFTNAAVITIGATAGVGGYGLVLGGTFNNNVGGQISIDHCNNVGLSNNGGTITNAATITIGATAGAPGFGFFNNSVFNNTGCAVLTLSAGLSNSGSFTNAGLFTVNTNQAHTNTALTNNGVIAYPQGNPIPNVTNNKLIVEPISTACGPVTPALAIGGSNDLVTATTWYQDAALATVAGSYSPNTFTPTNLSAGGPYPVYFSVADPGNGCTRTIAISVTVTGTASTWYLDADEDTHYVSSVLSCTSPGAGYNTTSGTLGDCDDNDNTKWQSALLFIDVDGDGYNAGQTTICYGATAPAGYSLTTSGSDCNDADASVHTPLQYYVDADHDGYGSTTTAMLCSLTAPVGYSTNNTDCNDGDVGVHAPVQYYVDADHDGYGSATTAMLCSSTAPVGYSINNTDCNDGDAGVHTPVQYYVDADHDGYGSATTAMLCSLTAPVGYSMNNTDCNDGDAGVHTPVQYYVDADHDGYGSATTAMLCSLTAPVGYSMNNTDCNDGNAAINPNTKWYKDADNDNYSDGSTQTQCIRPTGYKLTSELTAISGDCNDGNAAINPGAAEICGNGIDDNCNGQVDEGCSTCNVIATVSFTPISCYGGLATITVKASGGTAPYQYRLSGGLTFQIYNFFIVGAGTYSITVKDKKGCTKTISGIVIAQPLPLTLTLVQKTDVTCRNGSNGKIVVSASGGTTPYSYKLNSGSYQSSGTFQNLKAGTYTLIAKDAKGCIKTISVVIKNGTGSCSSLAMSVAKPIGWFLNTKITPNPSMYEFTLNLEGNSAEPVNIRVIDMYGRTVHQVKGTANQSYKFGQHFAGGVYIIEIIQGEHVKTLKAVKN